ncbi:PREDICTED: uncharacterized protein LOC100641039 isoform X2 [Amphimedon queenslandica]|uniref:CUB domain-containing protein n=1 Tax=Amphimedon queenslandica TaxID=400682 RepID=A0AAN0J0I7_AMPQE|nr:PREDICTED: uncharacterized protein LOC100641039 isoform X2 [Amphimedon queenslandica]|eukprot:XP_019850226.1 PREDICTED: uncharacterized protein LOC100641039 isoform X2 [Amphimedon queenslandica]
MFQSSHSSVFILLLLATAGTSFNYCEGSTPSANVSLQVDCYESKILFRYNWKGGHDLKLVHSPNPTCYLSNGTEIPPLNSEVTLIGSKLTYNDTVPVFLQETQFPLETGAYCNWSVCMLVIINEDTHNLYITSEDYSCRLKREVTISSSSIDQLLTTTDNYDILATPTIFQESYHLDTSPPNEIILTAALTTSRKETTATSEYYTLGETTNVKRSSVFPSGESTASVTGTSSTKNGLSSSSNAPTITSNPIARGHQNIVTYTLIGVMILILGFSLIALILSCMSIKRRKKSRRTAQVSSMNELHTATCNDNIEEARHTLSLYKDNDLNGSVVTLLQSLDSSTLLCKASSDETTKLRDSRGDGERYMTTGSSISQDSDEYKRLARSEIELRYIAGNTPAGQKSKSLSALNIDNRSPHHLLLVNERGAPLESDSSLFNVERESSESSSCSYLHTSNHEHTLHHGNNTLPVGSRTRSVRENDKEDNERNDLPQVWQPGTRAKNRMTTHNNNGPGTTIETEYIAHGEISKNGENVIVPVSLAAAGYEGRVSANNNNNNTDLKSHAHLIQLKSVSSCDSGYLETPPTSYSSQNIKSMDSDTSYCHFEDTFEEYDKTGGGAKGCGLLFASDSSLNDWKGGSTLKKQRIDNITYIDLPQY